MISKHFKIHELVPKNTFEQHNLRAWRFIDERLIKTIDKLRELFPEGTITINNYFWGGDRNWSGLRTPDSKYYSSSSMHTLGKAVDCIFSHYSTDTVRTYILEHPGEFPYIKGIELGVGWLHIDVRNEDQLMKFTG